MLRETPEVSLSFISNFDVICDLLFVSYMKGNEESFSTPLFDFILTISGIIRDGLEKGRKVMVEPLNAKLGFLLSVFFTISNAEKVLLLMRSHIRLLTTGISPALFEHASILLWSFLIPFSYTNEFAYFCASQLSFQTIGSNAFAPYHPIMSPIFLALHNTLRSEAFVAIEEALTFLSRFCISLEDNATQQTYRVGLLLCPLLDIVASTHRTPVELRQDMLPIVLFLLAYRPRILLKSSFAARSDSLKEKFVDFLHALVGFCTSKLTNVINQFDGLFHQLTS
jgi:hypothetical protein